MTDAPQSRSSGTALAPDGQPAMTEAELIDALVAFQAGESAPDPFMADYKRVTLGGMIAAVYGKMDAEDCAIIDREWARQRGYIVPADGTSTLAQAAADSGKTRQYYYRVTECTAQNVDSPDCICWYDEGTGPLADNKNIIRTWREKLTRPTQPTQPTQGGDKGEAVAWFYEMAFYIKPADENPLRDWKQVVTIAPPPTIPAGGVRNVEPLYRGSAYSSREAVIEECAQVAEAQKQQFLSTQYAANQPFGSLCERFACDEVAKAIRAILVVSSTDRGGK